MHSVKQDKSCDFCRLWPVMSKITQTDRPERLCKKADYKIANQN